MAQDPQGSEAPSGSQQSVVGDQSPVAGSRPVSTDHRPPGRRGGLRTFASIQNSVDYRYLFFGNLFANCAQWLQFISLGWLALDVSGSAFHSIMAVAVRALPTLALGPWAGVLADRYDRRKLALAVQVVLMGIALVFAILLAQGRVDTIWHVYIYTLVTGVAYALKQPVRQALIANTVRREDMGNALALSAMTTTSMRLGGAAIGGILIEALDFHWNFFVEAGLYLGVIVLLLPMRTPYQEASTARRASPLSNLVEGIAYILRSQAMRRLMYLNFARTFVFMPLLMLLPAYTAQSLDAGAGVGTAMVVSMGIGGVTATFIMSTWGFFTRKGLVCLITMLSGSAVVLTLGLSHWVFISVPIMVVMGLSQSHFIVSNQTLIQTIVPDTLRGRVSSVWHYEQGLIPLFAGGIGIGAEFIGIGPTMTWVGGFALVLGAFFLVRFKDIRELD